MEDEGIVARDIQLTLQDLGYEVVGIAATGEDAVRLADEQHPDLVLMDIHLRGAMDGTEAARRIHDAHETPVIFLTAYNDPDTLHRAKQSQPYAYILKPFDERDLQTGIEVALHKNRADAEVRRQRRLLSAILDAMDDCVVGVDAATGVTFVNGRTAALTGHTEEELVGRRVADVLLVRPPAGAADLAALVGETMGRGEPVRMADGAAVQDANDAWIPMHVEVYPLVSGKVVRGAVVFLHDRSAHQRISTLEAEVATLRTRLLERAQQLI